MTGVSSFQDANDWLATVQELRHSKDTGNAETLHRLLDSVPGIVYRCTPDENAFTEYVSEGSSRLTGYTPDAFLSRQVTLRSLIEPADQEEVSCAIRAAVENRESFELFYRLNNAGGDVRWVWDRGAPIFSSGGDVQALEGLIMDVTGYIDLQRMHYRIQEFETGGRTLSKTIHEFNNIFTGIIGFVDLLVMKRKEDPALIEALGRIRHLVQRAMAANQKLRQESKQPPPGRAETDLNEVLAKVAYKLERHKRTSLEVKIHRHSQPVPVFVDPGQLEQVLLNLARNSEEAMPDGGTLSLRIHPFQGAEENSGVCCVEVSDTGCGVATGDASKICKPFFSTKGRPGMGLTVAFATIRDHGGRIEVESRPGAGSCFRVFLPVLEDVNESIDSDWLFR